MILREWFLLTNGFQEDRGYLVTLRTSFLKAAFGFIHKFYQL